MTMMVTKIECVDYGAQGEYGFFGKVVAGIYITPDTTERDVREFKADMECYFGKNAIGFREVEVIPACLPSHNTP